MQNCLAGEGGQNAVCTTSTNPGFLLHLNLLLFWPPNLNTPSPPLKCPSGTSRSSCHSGQSCQCRIWMWLRLASTCLLPVQPTLEQPQMCLLICLQHIDVAQGQQCWLNWKFGLSCKKIYKTISSPLVTSRKNGDFFSISIHSRRHLNILNN